MSVIKINDLTKDYGNNKGVFDINLDINRGEVFGFLGPNGAGKTTTIRHIMGFIKPDKGNCKVNDMDAFTDAYIVQKDIGYIPGEISFMDNMTGSEFIKFIGNYRGLKDFTKANDLIKLYELDTSTKIKKMSKGMKQKLGIIVAFMHEPNILILDEPTSGLDPLMQDIFIKMIHEEKKKGKTILMSSHMFEEIEKTSDKVAIIKNGRIVVTSTIKDLKKIQSKKFTITLSNIKDVNKFKSENLDIVNIFKNKVTILLQNNMKEFISILNNYNVIDIEEDKQGLEEIFLNFYGGSND